MRTEGHPVLEIPFTRIAEQDTEQDGIALRFARWARIVAINVIFGRLHPRNNTKFRFST
jgi:hypothetical protein